MGNKKETPPNSVVHYTSIEVINKMFNQALEDNTPNIIVHLSHLTMMNDADEGNLVLNEYFTDSDFKKELKEKWDNDFYPSHIPFVFSTIATNFKTKNRGSIPMWGMYGDNFKGALIRFKGEKVQEFCKEKYIFSPCDYRKKDGVKALIKDFNKNQPPFEEIIEKACLTKHYAWENEHEWRVIVLSSKENVKTKSTPRGIIEYIEVDFPLNLIEEICLGPLSNNQTLESIKLLSDKLKVKFNDNVHFKVAKSNILIQ